MHEAGIARGIAETLREEGLLGVPVRVLVTGGHDEPAAFDASLLFHLGLAAPENDLALIRIVHLPSERWCSGCGLRFEAVGEVDCPSCGAATMGTHIDERVEIEPDVEPRLGAGPGGDGQPGPDHDRPTALERPDDRVT